MGPLGDWRVLARWFACQQPERRPDEHTVFHFGCNGCAVAYEAQQAPPPEGAFVRWHETWDPEVLETMRVAPASSRDVSARVTDSRDRSR